MRRAYFGLLGLLILFGGEAAFASERSERSELAYDFLVAQSLAQEGSYAAAVAAFDELVTREPDETYLRIEYAELLFRLGRTEDAGVQATAARRLDPENPEVLRLYGQIQLRLAEGEPAALARAREAFEILRESRPNEIEPLVTLGQIYLSENRSGEAVDLFLDLLTRRPGDRMLFSFLLEALQRSGRLAEGEEPIRAFVERDPGFPKARLALSQILSERGDHEEAARLLEAATQEGFDGPDVVRQLAVERFRSGDSEGALLALERLLEELPEDGGARYLRSLALVELGRQQEARVELEGLSAERPDGIEVAMLLSRLYEDDGRVDDAARVLESAARALLASDQLRPARTAQLRLAEVFARAEAWSRVIEISDRLLAGPAASGRIEAALLRADALAQLERGQEALDFLEPWTDGEEAEPRLVAKRAELLFGLERDDEARQALEPLALASDLDSVLLAASVYQRIERYEEAIPLLEQLGAERPDSPSILFRLGASYERSGRLEDAETSFRQLLEVAPDFAPALNYLGYMWAERGENLDEAFDLVRRAIELDPDNGAYLDSLGWVYFQMGRYGEARGHLERAAELVPDDAVVYEHLGDLYLAVGEVELAQENYEQAVRLGGENLEQVRRKLERLSDEL